MTISQDPQDQPTVVTILPGDERRVVGDDVARRRQLIVRLRQDPVRLAEARLRVQNNAVMAALDPDQRRQVLGFMADGPPRG